MAEKKDFEKVLTPPFRMSFPHLFEMYSMDGKNPKYQLSMLFPKKADISVLVNLWKKLIREKFNGAKPPDDLKSPFLDGDKQKDPSNHGCWLIRTSTTRRVGVIDGNKNPIAVASDVISGYWARATVNCYYWPKKKENAFRHGISFGLQNVQLLTIEQVIHLYKGQDLGNYELIEAPFGGTAGPAEDDFDEAYSPSGDPGNYQSDDSPDWTGTSPISDTFSDPFAL